MEKLIEKIKSIPKGYFSLADIEKISKEKEKSLKVAISRLVKAEKIIRLQKNFYALDISKVSSENFAVETYKPSYLSFEWVLARYGILSQKPFGLTLATSRRAKRKMLFGKILAYRHMQPKNFWGYRKEENYLIADPEKSFLDLAYLSLNGYAKFDVEEMNLDLLDKEKIRRYLKKINSKKLDKLMGEII